MIEWNNILYDLFQIFKRAFWFVAQIIFIGISILEIVLSGWNWNNISIRVQILIILNIIFFDYYLTRKIWNRKVYFYFYISWLSYELR